MTEKISINQALRRNYRELIFVFAAFMLMVLVSYFFIGHILRVRLLTGTEELLHSAEANIKAGLAETEITLVNSCYVVQDMVEQNASRQEILNYLTVTTERIQRADQGLVNQYGIYGFINGEFYDGRGFDALDGYIPQGRPWYQAAIQSGRTVAYTEPYEDARTGDTIISAARNIDIKNGDIAGILSVDMGIRWLADCVDSLNLTPGGYGMLLNRGMVVITHPDSALMGRRLHDLGRDYGKIAQTLRNGGAVFARRIIDSNGSSSIVFFRQIFNGWYVGVVTPYHGFYRDLEVSAAVLIVLGVGFSLVLCFVLLRLSAAKVRADENSKSKSSFLASASHEIRTPMNAIIGMAELLLREELSDKARGYAQDIRQAGNNLVSIINDILDFSKIEAGKMEIVPVKYLLSTLINDTVNIICVKIEKKPLRFLTNIDGKIPNSLIGDEVRLRQILLNLLSNAVKYSDKGHISLAITEQKREAEQVWLKIAVADTGKGIKPEDMEKLFGEFVQVDKIENVGIEGTGLGLAVTRQLCTAMGGNMTVESEYGKGSTFTATIPQRIVSPEPFASVEDALKKKVLVYEDRVAYAGSVCWSLENMGVYYSMVTNKDVFAKVLMREEWFYVFSGYSLYENIKPLMEQPDTAFPGGKKPPLALILERDAETVIPNVRLLSLPVQSVSIANILNGKADSKSYTESFHAPLYAFPRARMLVVDDIATNLKVAEGLLDPYGVAVDTSLSGAQAVEMVKQRRYDMVLMDHMMPEMNGIEATAAIRTWEQEQLKQDSGRKQMPIIAATANAVTGMREMFLESGFNDFLTKPIDIAKLDEILNLWMPKEKREAREGNEGQGDSPDSSSPLPVIPGINAQHGLATTGGKMGVYRTVLITFCNDAEERMPMLQTTPAVDALPVFANHVHALKSAAASIGAADVSAKAAALEAAGKTGDTAFIRKNLGAFAECLDELVWEIQAWKKATEAHSPEKPATGGEPGRDITPLLHQLATALQLYQANEIDQILEQLNGCQADEHTQAALKQISEEAGMMEYSKAGEILEGLLKEKG